MKTKNNLLSIISILLLSGIASCKKPVEDRITGPVEFFGITDKMPGYVSVVPLQLYLSARGYYVPLKRIKITMDPDMTFYTFNDTTAGDSTYIAIHTKETYDADSNATFKSYSLQKFSYIRAAGFDSAETAQLHRLYDNDTKVSFDSVSIHYSAQRQ